MNLIHHLPILDDQVPGVSGDGESLAYLLKPVNDPEVQARIGQERTIPVDADNIVTTEGHRYPVNERDPATGHPVQGWQWARRMLLRDGPDIVAALQVGSRFVQGYQNVLSALYVRPDRRRQGLASALVLKASSEYPTLQLDSNFTEPGARFFRIGGEQRTERHRG